MEGQIIASYCGPAPAPAEVMARWNTDPILLLAFALALALIAWRGEKGARRGLLIGALGVLALVFVSPFCALGVSLFSARVAHHGLLVVAAAPLIAYGLRLRRVPLAAACAAQTAVFWLWHAPSAYQAALSSDALFWVMQISLLGSATAFWMALRSASAPAAVAGLLAAMVQMGLLGALITFAGAPLYGPHLTTSQAWGFTPLADQQLAGLIMWAPMSGAYLALAMGLIGRWIGPDPKRAAA